MDKEKETKQEEGKFIGINWLTGRKIYLTPNEEAIIKKQWKLVWWVFGIIFGGYALLMLILILTSL